MPLLLFKFAWLCTLVRTTTWRVLATLLREKGGETLLVKRGGKGVTLGGNGLKMDENGEGCGAPAPVPVRLVVHLGTYHYVAGISYTFGGKWVGCPCFVKKGKRKRRTQALTRSTAQHCTHWFGEEGRGYRMCSIVRRVTAMIVLEPHVSDGTMW